MKTNRRRAAPANVKAAGMKEAKDGSQHIVRTLRTLEFLSQRAWKAQDLAAALSVHPRTAGRLLERLLSEGYVAETDREREYTATLRIVTLAGQILERTDLVRVAFPYVVQLRNRTGEASHLSVAGEGAVVHLLQETGESVVMVKPNLGEEVPYHCSAVGKVLLAYLPVRRDRIASLDFKAQTNRTIVDPDAYFAELGVVRQQGYAFDNGEFHAELRCIAAPVFGATREIIAAIGIQAPSSRLRLKQVPNVAAIVVAVANELSAALGYTQRSTEDSFRLPPSLTPVSRLAYQVGR
jgi:IclR family transcriptional regulator, KDG regulon repressor